MIFTNFHRYYKGCNIYLLFLVVSALSHPCLYGKYPIQNFTPSVYKAGIQNIDFAQNRDMTLFVANNLGVLAYNGNEWEVNAFKTGKKQRSLAFDEKTNRLYSGSQGAFGYFDNDWNYVSLSDKIPAHSRDFDEVWDVFISHSKVYFCTFQGIYVYDGQSITAIEREEGFYRTFHCKGKLFAQSRAGEIFDIHDTQLMPPNFGHHPGNETIAGIIAHDEGYLLFYNSGNIEYATSFQARRIYGNLGKSLQGTYVNHVLQLSDSRLVISTQTAGLYLYDLHNQTIENITEADGLLSNTCLRAFQDYSGNLWVGMQNGIALIDIHSPIQFIGQEINIQGSGYEAFNTNEGTYYTTSNGIYFRAKQSAQCVFLRGTEGPAYGMQKIAGKLYAGHHTGLFLLEKGLGRRLANTNGLWEVKQLRSKPQYAVGGTYSGLYLFRLNGAQELQPVQAIEGFIETSRFFEEDQKGSIWVGQFYKGLYHLTLSADLKQATARKISKAHGLPVDEQLILSRIDNELYLATPKGVYRIDYLKERITKADIFSETIGEQQVHLLVQDNQKNIHIYTDNLVGFFKQISASHFAFVPSSLFQFRYSFNNDLLKVSVNTNDGVLFNANEGFIQYRPELENRLGVEKPLVVNKIVNVAGHRVLYERKPFESKPGRIPPIVVSHTAKVLKFYVETFQFNDLNNRQYRYFLSGFDDEYGPWTNTPDKEYTNLREGQYEFIVQTKNHLGQIVTCDPVSIEVKPPLHRSLLAQVMYVMLGISALVLFSRQQKRRYSRKTKAVEAAKEKELAKKQLELIEIEGQKEQELRIMEEEKMKMELQHLNNRLASSTMNLVVKNEFIETIKEELKEVRRKGKSAETTQALEKIVKKIDSTLRLQEDWEQFEFHFDQVHGHFFNRLRDQFHDLTPNEQKLCALLRLNLNTKDIANLMGVSLRGVEIARYRLRKKLGLRQGRNLSKYILEY